MFSKDMDWQPPTVRRGLILIVAVALLPFALVSFIQSALVLDSVRSLIGNRLAASALTISERERDAFIIARHSLAIASRRTSVIEMNEDCTKALEATLQETRAAVLNYARTDASGRPRCSARPFDPKQDFSQTDWWKTAMANKGFTLSKPIIGPISKAPVMILLLPIEKSGKQDGTISAAIGLDNIQQSLNNSVRGSNAMAALVDAKGATLLSSNGLKLKNVDVSGEQGPLAEAEGPAGSEWVYSVAPLERRELFVLYAEPKSSTLSPSVRQLLFNMLLPIMAILLASIAIWFGANRLVVRWLERLGMLSRNFANGDLSGNEASFAGAPAEVAALSADMHAMARAIEARDQQLLASLETKTALTREIHHRVKNNLQIVMSLLTLQASRIEDVDVSATLAQTRARIAALALIHRLMYQQEDNEAATGEISIGTLLGELATQLRVANRDRPYVELVPGVGDDRIPLDHAVPVALFVVEAVTNAYRHAFREGDAGQILLTTERDGISVTLSITDNGGGYDVASGGQMGTDLMQAFATQVNGSSQVTSDETGTTVSLRFTAVPR